MYIARVYYIQALADKMLEQVTVRFSAQISREHA